MSEQTIDNEIQSVSPYNAAKIVNVALQKANSIKRVKPQMLYNYTKKGVAFNIRNINDRKEIILDEKFVKWVNNYVSNTRNKTEFDAESVHEQLFTEV